MDHRAVTFSKPTTVPDPPTETTWWPGADAVLEAATQSDGSPEPMLRALAADIMDPPVPGTGQTRRLWEMLATVAAIDLVAARTLEPHLDAAAILRQADLPWQPGRTWGVYAAEGPNMKLEAKPATRGFWTLHGVKPWCSLAERVSHALITAHTAQGRRLFAVPMYGLGVSVLPSRWVSRGMAQLPSGSVQFDGACATPVGETGWYLEREGFAVGGVGVAACWFGGAVGVLRHLIDSARRREPDQLALAWIGEADRLMCSAAELLGQAALRADEGSLDSLTAARVRGHVASVCQRLLRISAEATGPGPLATDEAHARRVADLGIYLRQHHAARDDAALGRMVLTDRATQGAFSW
ncbi:acyl-CoA dehydrogenase [Glutamicibacter sp. X7]